MGLKVLSGGNTNIDIVYPWMKVVAVRNDIPTSTVLRIWNLHCGHIKNLRSKPGTKAAKFVTPGGVLTEKYFVLIGEMETEKENYIRQTGNIES